MGRTLQSPLWGNEELWLFMPGLQSPHPSEGGQSCLEPWAPFLIHLAANGSPFCLSNWSSDKRDSTSPPPVHACSSSNHQPIIIDFNFGPALCWAQPSNRAKTLTFSIPGRPNSDVYSHPSSILLATVLSLFCLPPSGCRQCSNFILNPEQWSQPSYSLGPFNTASHIVATSPTIKSLLLPLHNCNFTTVINNNVNIWPVSPLGVRTNRLRTAALDKGRRLGGLSI